MRVNTCVVSKDKKMGEVHMRAIISVSDKAGVIDFDKDVANLDEVLDTARSSSLQFKYREDGGGDGTNDYVKVLTEEIIP